jgi:serralysin
MAGFKTIAGSGYGNPFTDSLVWGGQIWDMSTGPIRVKFGGANRMFEWRDEVVPQTPHQLGENSLFPDIADWVNRYTWWNEDINAMDYAASLYESVANIQFTAATNYADANLVWWKCNLPSGALGVHETPDSYRDSGHQRWGYFDPTKISSWTKLTFGGDGLNTIIHELGHGLGLAHPHDGGYNSDASVFAGVSSASDLGTYGHNQSVYTVMSYNPGLSTVRGDQSYGTQGGLGAFDIAALQAMYGANMSTATGNDVYELPKYNMEGTGWFGIWDAGGIDTISAATATNAVTIDLRAATLIATDPNAGGFVSHQRGIAGGYTIAHKVVIENAIGGSGDDTLIGNSATNNLNGGLGNDTYLIDSANDVVVDSGGIDTVYATFNYSNPNIENVYVNGVLYMANGHQVIDGFAVVKGTSGKNTLVGSDGNDKMYGYAGNDTLVGSKGIDIFVFNTKLNAKTNRDAIKAFAAKEDKIWLDNAIFKKLGKGTESKPVKLSKSFFKFGSQAGDKNDYILIDKGKGIASYDVDGNGPGKAVAFAIFDKKHLPSLSNFFVV